MAILPWFRPFRIYFLILSTLCGLTPLLWAHGDYHELVTEIERALAKEPDNANLHFRLAVAHQEHGEWTSALISLERTERLAPGIHPTAFIQGLALAKGEKWQAAETVLSEFITSYPNHPQALAARARVRLQLRRPTEALTDFRSSLRSYRHPEPDLFLEVTNLLISQGNRREAVNLLNDGITRLGYHPELLERVIELEAIDGQLDAAIVHIDAIRQITPTPEEWLILKAKLQAQNGDLDASRTTWCELEKNLLALPNLQQGQPRIRDLLNQALTALGRPSVPATIIAAPVANKHSFPHR